MDTSEPGTTTVEYQTNEITKYQLDFGPLCELLGRDPGTDDQGGFSLTVCDEERLCERLCQGRQVMYPAFALDDGKVYMRGSQSIVIEAILPAELREGRTVRIQATSGSGLTRGGGNYRGEHDGRCGRDLQHHARCARHCISLPPPWGKCPEASAANRKAMGTRC